MKHAVSLDRRLFLERIYNYEKNPGTWIYLDNAPGVLLFHSHLNNFCKELEPAVEIIAKKGRGKYHVYTIDIDTEKEVSKHLMIDTIPTFYICPKTGNPVIMKNTINLKEIKKMIDKLI